jgi:hypothetical protein
MPAIGDEHPGRADCVLVRREPEALTSDYVKFRLHYSDRGLAELGWAPDTIQGHASLSQQETNLDAGGYLMWLRYTFPSNYPHNTDLRDKEITVADPIPFLAPETSITISRWEYTNPSSDAREYIGTVNEGPWSGDINAAARTWLCSDISWVSKNQGTSYYVTYTFQYRPDTWDSTVSYRDPYTGETFHDCTAVADVDMPPGMSGWSANASYPYTIGTFQMYTMKDFDLLDL